MSSYTTLSSSAYVGSCVHVAWRPNANLGEGTLGEQVSAAANAIKVLARAGLRLGWACSAPPEKRLPIPWSDFSGLLLKTIQRGFFYPICHSNVDVHALNGQPTQGHGDVFASRRSAKAGCREEQLSTPTGESPTVCTIRNIIHEIETVSVPPKRIRHNEQSVEANLVSRTRFTSGTRVALPVAGSNPLHPGG